MTQLRNLGGLPDKGSRTAGRKAPNYLTRSGGDCPEASRESNGSLLEAAEDKNQQFLYIRGYTAYIQLSPKPGQAEALWWHSLKRTLRIGLPLNRAFFGVPTSFSSTIVRTSW